VALWGIRTAESNAEFSAHDGGKTGKRFSTKTRTPAQLMLRSIRAIEHHFASLWQVRRAP
jgi:hypothetical protein